VQITDNGTGIPQGFTFDSAEGFGLSMVKILTHQLDGELSFQSNSSLNRGTTFVLTIQV
jgi:two-component sensor histidine kinase